VLGGLARVDQARNPTLMLKLNIARENVNFSFLGKRRDERLETTIQDDLAKDDLAKDDLAKDILAEDILAKDDLAFSLRADFKYRTIEWRSGIRNPEDRKFIYRFNRAA
jgi:hypothetical protein